MNKIEIQEGQEPAVGEFFCSICHRRTQIIKGILHEIKIQEGREPTAGEIF